MAKRRNNVSLAGRPARKTPEPDVRDVVLSQPHRRGNTDQKCASVFGQFVLRNHLRQEIYDAGQAYAQTVARWRICKGIPTQSAPSGLGGSFDPDDDAVASLKSAMVGMDKAMLVEGINAYLAVRQLIIDENEIGMDQDGAAIFAATALAEHLGYMTRVPIAA